MPTNKPGTNVASAITTYTDEDEIAVAYANEIEGGRHSVSLLADRNNIFKARRKIGMVCYVEETDKTYILKTNPLTRQTQDSDWEVSISNIDDIVLDDNTTLENKVKEIEYDISKKYVVICLNPLNIGVGDIEQVIPFNANIVSITANIPLDTVTTEDINIDIEKCNNRLWSKVCDITIDMLDIDLSADLSLSTPVAITVGDRLRLNITSVQDNIESLVVTIGLVLTD